MQAESPITVACIQMEPKIGEKKANVAHSLDKIAEAAGKGARLIVLPELCNSGYVFASRHEAFTLAEPVPIGPTSEVWLEAARRHFRSSPDNRKSLVSASEAVTSSERVR